MLQHSRLQPSAPEAPPAPRCDPTLTSHDRLAIELLEPLTSNGQPIQEYQIKVFYDTIRTQSGMLYSSNESLFYSETRDATSSTAVSVTSASVQGTSSINASLLSPETNFLVIARARNALGWSSWSPPSCSPPCQYACATKPIPPPAPISPLTVGLPLGIVLLVILVLPSWACR